MSDQPEFDRTGPGMKKKILTLAVILIIIFSAALLLVNPLLNSPYVSNRISAFLSERLRQKTVVGGLRLSAGSLMANGVSIANPQGFPAGNLIRVGYLEIYPEWRSLLMGKREIRSIRIHGLHAELLKDGTGVWNFSTIRSLFKGKGGGAEMQLGELRLDGGSLSMAGRGIKDISLAVRDLSTNGSSIAKMDLAFSDENGSHFRIHGSGRLGAAPALEMKLTAPAISLKPVKGYRIPIDTERGRGVLDLLLAFGNDELKVRGEARVDPLIFKMGDEKTGAHRAGLSFSGRYLLKSDQAVVDFVNLSIDDGSLRLQARGVVERLRKERDFSLEISHQGIQLADILSLLPSKLTGGLQITGKILPATVSVKGSGGAGITSAGADLAIRHLTLSRYDRLLVGNINADANITGQVDGWGLKGRVSQGERDGIPLLLFRDIPFNMGMDRRFRPTSGGVPSLSAEFAGVPVRGSVLFRENGPEPISARIDIGRGNLAGMSRRFSIKGLELAKGTVTGFARAGGDLSGKIHGDASFTLSGIQGRYAGKEIRLVGLRGDGSIRRIGGAFSASARIGAREGVLDGRMFSFSIPCTLRGRVFAVEGGEGRFEKASLRVGKLDISLPEGLSPTERKIPLGVSFSGISISRGEIGAGGVSGVIRANLSRIDRKIVIEGGGLLEVPVITFRDTKSGSLSARFGTKGRRVTVEANGEMLGGKVEALAGGDLGGLRSGAGYTLNIKGVSGERLSEMAGKPYPVRISAGALDLDTKGKFGGVNGLTTRISLTGRDMALSGKNRRTILSGGMLNLSADLAKGDLLIREAVAAVGGKLRIALKGELKNAAAPEREGDFTLELPRVEIASLLDVFANALPPALQEAGATGSVRIGSKIRTRGKGGRVNGEIALEDGGLDIPSQKLTVTGVSGKVPFDMELNGSPPKQWDKGGVKRDNYRGMLSLLQAASRGGHNLVIERIRFGAADFNDTRLSIGAGNGVTEVKWLASRLFLGEIHGQGSFTLSGGGRFGGDILVHDLSLRELCDSYPAIRGYMSGRVDGFASLFAEGGGVSALKGLMEFWSRSAAGEKMMISKEFLQKISGKKLKGLFFTKDRPYDRGEIAAYLDDGYLTFQTMDISHTNLLGMRDLSVTVAPVQNKISLGHLLAAIREAASRGKAATGGGGAEPSPPATEFKWEE